jgi:SAM-dependent methyltransferase
MDAFRACLRDGADADVRASVLRELSAYHDLTAEECIHRCIHWEQWSVQEWEESQRGDGLAEFYGSVQSWAFDLLWYDYLQAVEYAWPVKAIIAAAITSHVRSGTHLDFGSGIGSMSQLMNCLGFESDLADVSSTLLAFARYRLERRGVHAGYIDLTCETLPADRYDAITAIDTLTHVDDLPSAIRQLHAALKPGGLLVANFDVRPPTPENAWHLYADDAPLRYRLHRAGFEPMEELGHGFSVYRRVEPGTVRHQLRGLRDMARYRLPKKPLRMARRALRRGD